MTTENTFITAAPTAIAQPAVATANTTAESTAGTAPPASEAHARMQQLDLENQVRLLRRGFSEQRASAADPPPRKKLKAKATTAPKPTAKAKAAPKQKAKGKTAPKAKAKAKTAPKPKAKAKAKTAPKPNAKAKTCLKASAKAKTLLKATTKQGLKPTTTTTKPSTMPSQPAGRTFSPIMWGPCTIYHGGKQRKYRLKEYCGSRRTTSFNDWQKMMTYIRTL